MVGDGSSGRSWHEEPVALLSAWAQGPGKPTAGEVPTGVERVENVE